MLLLLLVGNGGCCWFGAVVVVAIVGYFCFSLRFIAVDRLSISLIVAYFLPFY